MLRSCYRLRGEEWIADCLDMNIQAIDVDPILNETTYSGVSQSTKNKLYKSDFLIQTDENKFAKFKELMVVLMKLMIQGGIYSGR